MQELTIINIEGENRIDSRLVATSLNIEHKHFMETLRKYQAKLESLGALPFETAMLKHEHYRGSTTMVYVMLNEDQAIFAATLSRNTEEVVEFKLALTKAFSEARKAKQNLPAQPLTMLELAEKNLELAQTNVHLARDNQQYKAQLEIAAPKVTMWKAFLDSDGLYTMDEVAKLFTSNGARVARSMFIPWGQERRFIEKGASITTPILYALCRHADIIFKRSKCPRDHYAKNNWLITKFTDHVSGFGKVEQTFASASGIAQMYDDLVEQSLITPVTFTSLSVLEAKAS